MKFVTLLLLSLLVFSYGFRIRQDDTADDGGDAAGDVGAGQPGDDSNAATAAGATAGTDGGFGMFDPSTFFNMFAAFTDPQTFLDYFGADDLNDLTDQIATAFQNAFQMYGDAFSTILAANLQLWGINAPDGSLDADNAAATVANAATDAAAPADDGGDDAGDAADDGQ